MWSLVKPPPMTKYTRRLPPGNEGHGRSEGQGGSESRKGEASGSWMAHNPACDDLPHVPCWSLVQGSHMDSFDNCHEFYSTSLPPAEHLYQKNKDRSRLLEDHVRLGVNYFAMTQEIVHEWSSMREQIMEFENTKREFVMDRERFNVEKKGLNWRVSDAEEKLAKEQKLNAEHQEEWTAACARTNRDLKLARDEAVKLKGEKDKASQEVMHLTASLKEKEDQADTAHKANEEALAHIVDLEKAVENPKAQAKASEEVAHELGEDCKWLINHGVPLLADSLMAFEDLAK
ncbi:hypothetical protein HanPI659440_Chr12g0463001 [Helianthus annuus]|nr:hypothetical protein HanPI659440_Chr12g0463001 [Helianthus annuus]